jgi:hypothetical protein
MITEKELNQAINECLRDPITGNKRAVLADLIIIQDYLFGDHHQPVERYSYSPPTEQTEAEMRIKTEGGSEFLLAVQGRSADRVLKLIDELVEAVKILHPRMYTTFIDKVQDL